MIPDPELAARVLEADIVVVSPDIVVENEESNIVAVALEFQQCIGSLSTPMPSFPVSSSLRAALASFTKLYADSYAADGIRMNNILPGFVDSYPESEESLKRIPMGRYASVTEIAKTAHFLVSADAGYITGQNIRVDGGITRSVGLTSLYRWVGHG